MQFYSAVTIALMDKPPAHMQPLTERPAWQALEAHYQLLRHRHLQQLFDEDPERGRRFAAEAAGIYLDYSKNHVTEQTMSLLTQLARESGLSERIAAMFRGDKINVTEQRAALHMALRAASDEHFEVEGVDVAPMAQAELEKMAAFADQVRNGQWWGYTGRHIRNVINIGIGGSHLGPALACDALWHYRAKGLYFRFVSSLDDADFAEATRDLVAEETLFVICSKTFTTAETLINAERARAWCLRHLGSDQAINRHFVAVSGNAAAVADFGIGPDNHFALWDWVGGRYSLSSAVGLSTMIAVGPQHFRAMLSGYHAMDRHFLTAPFERNLPVLMGLVAIWYNNFFSAQTTAVLPYQHGLRHLPAYLQQLFMESNGKSVTLAGEHIGYNTASICWGQPGTEGQHSFYQLLHHGTRLVPCDFIGFCRSPNQEDDGDRLLLANLLAQTAALAFGSEGQGNGEAQEPHRRFGGNRPSNILIAEQLTPEILGALLALYEHSVFTQGVIWNINSFDQWGVELGKTLTQRFAVALANSGETHGVHDSSSAALIEYYRRSINPSAPST